MTIETGPDSEPTNTHQGVQEPVAWRWCAFTRKDTRLPWIYDDKRPTWLEGNGETYDLQPLYLDHPRQPDKAGEVTEFERLTEYEIQVLLGTTVYGCNMAPDRVFSLHMAWHRLNAIGLIDRTDGLAIVTDEGRAVVAKLLKAALTPQVKK